LKHWEELGKKWSVVSDQWSVLGESVAVTLRDFESVWEIKSCARLGGASCFLSKKFVCEIEKEFGL